MGKTQYGSNIVTDGLVFCVDAANPRSYPGTGTTWYDVSAGGNGIDGTLSDDLIYRNINVVSGLQAYWNFDTTGSDEYTIVDISGYGHSGSFSGAFIRPNGIIENAAHFGPGSPYINVDPTISFPDGQDFTFTTWFNWAGDNGGSYSTILYSNIDNADMIIIRPSDGELSIVKGGYSAARDIGFDSASMANEWHFLTVVRNDGGFSASLDAGTIDGYDGGEDSLIPIHNRSPDDPAYYIQTIGYNSSGTSWTGSLDEMRIYNRQLSQTEIETIYTNPYGTTHQDSMDFVTGGGSIPKTGWSSVNSVDFGDILQLGTESRTYSIWYKLVSVTHTNNHYLVTKTDNDSTPYRQALGFQTDGNFYCVLRGANNSTNNHDMYIDNPKIDLDWHQVVWGIDRSSNQYLYQDGTFITSSNISAISDQDFQLDRPFRVGSYTNTSNAAINSFNGSISNVSVYNRALTNTEIFQNYNALKWRFK